MRVDKAKIRYSAVNEVKQIEQNTRPSVFTEKFRGEFYNIDVTKLVPFHKQARKFFDEESLAQLGETIKTHGIRQPLTVISTGELTGMYEVVSGERRLRAAIHIGLKTVPCIIIHDQKAAVEIALIENTQRKDLHPLELAKAYMQLIDEKVCANKIEVAEKLSLAKSVVTETMQLLTLPEIVQTKLLENNVSSRKLFRELLEEKSSAKMLNMIEKYEAVNFTAKKTIKTKSVTVLKVVISNNQVVIDSKLLDTLAESQKNEIRQQLMQMFS